MAAFLAAAASPNVALQLRPLVRRPLQSKVLGRESEPQRRRTVSFGGAQGLGVGEAVGFAGAVLRPAFSRRRLAVRRAGTDSMDGEEAESSQTLAIVGLGNVGAQFDGTRHNIGFAAVDEVASKLLSTDRWALSGSIWQEAFGGTVLRLKRTASKGTDSYEEILLFKPSSMMNGSGRPVSELVSSLQLPESALVVIYDDMDLDVGRLRLRKSGSAGGQNGVKSILNHGFQKFLRLRLGVSRPKSGGREAIVGHVLGKFRHEEVELSKESLGRAAVAVEDLADGVSWDNVMNKFNRPATATVA